ncbi:prepilin-type N-terminal cleavage/methylation domain-containing protein [Pirellulales bacterium]|nr:prepilin-type N-terminal cleavage/methylation domain-containing protein [Pirellulales bacterium]
MERARTIRRRGLSLIELIAVVAIVALLATVAGSSVRQSVIVSKEKTCFHNRAQINNTVERYYLDHGAYPDDISDLDVVEYFPDGLPACPVSGNAYFLQNSTKRVVGHSGGGKGGNHF